MSTLAFAFCCLMGFIGFCSLILIFIWVVEDFRQAERAHRLVAETEAFLARQESRSC